MNKFINWLKSLFRDNDKKVYKKQKNYLNGLKVFSKYYRECSKYNPCR